MEFSAKSEECQEPPEHRRKLNLHTTFRGRFGHLLNVLYTFNLRPASRGIFNLLP